MSHIDTHIQELLHDHDCVIIPDFGGFITSKQASYFNRFNSVFYPAKKKILFNKHLVFNDGLLAAKVAEKQQLSMEEATQLLLQFKDDCYLKLNEEGRVELEKVGVLFFDKEKNIQFQQSATNFLTDSYGLSSIKINKTPERILVKPTSKVEEIVRVAPIKTDRKPEKKVAEKTATAPRKKRRVANLVPLLLVPVLVGCIFVLSKNQVFDQRNINMASFNPFSASRVIHYQPREIKPDLSVLDSKNFDLDEAELNALLSEKQVENTAVEIKTAVDSTYVKPKELVENNNYHLIVGCFGQKENAEGLVEKWNEKGYPSTIVDKKGGLYRVSIQSFGSKEEANLKISEIKRTYSQSIWVLKK